MTCFPICLRYDASSRVVSAYSPRLTTTLSLVQPRHREFPGEGLTLCCEQSLTHISRYIRRCIPVPLITAVLVRSVVRSPVMHPEDVGSTPGSVTFPPPGFDRLVCLRYDAASRVVSAYSPRLTTTLALVQPRHREFPYAKWLLVPEGNTACTLLLRTAQREIEVRVNPKEDIRAQWISPDPYYPYYYYYYFPPLPPSKL